jgi:hypothetical protein
MAFPRISALRKEHAFRGLKHHAQPHRHLAGMHSIFRDEPCVLVGWKTSSDLEVQIVVFAGGK